MLIRRAIYAGLLTGMGLLVGVLATAIWRGPLGGAGPQAWPAVFAPLVVTGIVAMRLAAPWVRGPGQAALAGALAGLVTALVAMPVFYLGMFVQVVLMGLPPIPWSGFPEIFAEAPFNIPVERIFVDLPFQFPFWWPLSRTLAPGVTVSRIGTVWLLFIPIGVVLSAIQAWLYYLIVEQARADLWAVRTIARYRARFQRKLMLGFVILGAMILAVGWLGFAVVEEMHQSLHRGRHMRHWTDHTLRIQANVRAETAALAQVRGDPSEANLRAVTTAAKQVTDELAHLKQFPPPPHPLEVVTNAQMPQEAARRLPAVREADARFAELDASVNRIVELIRAGNTAEAQTQLASLEPAQRAVDDALVALAGRLDQDFAAWLAEMDTARHAQEMVMLILVLLAAGAALPLGYVFSQVVVRPVEQVSIGLQRIGAGDFSSRVEVENQDELGELARRVNHMNDELARLYDELQARTHELGRSVQRQQGLAEVSQAVSSSLDLQTVLTTIVAHAVQLSGTDAGAIYEFEDAGQEFRLRATHQMSPELVAAIRETRILLEDPVVGRAATDRAAVQVADIEEGPAFALRAALERSGFRALLAVPLLRDERIVGTLVVRRRAPGQFPPETVALLETFATQSVLAIQNARLFQELEEKGRQLEVASQHKSQFLANMSHDLRTPLNAILGYTELILDGIYGEPPEKIREVMERVEKSGRHLLGLINDVLDLSKMEAGQLTLALDDYSLEQVVQTVVTAVGSLATEKRLALNVGLAPDLPPGHGDERRMTQVLLNLVGNAIKFTEAGEVKIEATASDGSFVVSVSDTGPGISLADQQKIFEEFQQADGAGARQPAAPVWACRSPDASSSCTAAESGSSRRRAGGRPSPLRCRSASGAGRWPCE